MIEPMPRGDLDFGPLAQSVGLGGRLRALANNNVMVIGGTVAVLCLVVPLVVLVALIATGNATDGGGLVVIAMVAAGGAYAVYDVLRQARGSSALARFAEVNGLKSISGMMRRDYAGSLFADGSHLVREAVRTRDDAFVEVGDRFPTRAPLRRSTHHVPELYLRAALAGEVAPGADPRALVTPELHEQLTRFAGPYAVEVSRREVTVFGSRRLDPEEPGRVPEAFALVDALAARAAACVGAPGSTDAVAPPGQALPGPVTPAATEPSQARLPSAFKVVGLTLAILVVLPIGFAVVLSRVDDGGSAVVVVLVLIMATMAVIGLLVRWSTTRGAGRRRTD